MATIVADVGGGAWTVGSTWVGGVAPTAADSAQIPLGAGNVTIDAGSVCRGADFATYTGTVTHSAGATLTIGDGTAALSNIALRLASGMTYTLGSATTSAISFISTSATVQTVDFVGKTSGNVTYNAASNGSWQMTGTHNTGATATVTLTKGTLDVNGQTCSWGLFVNNSGSTRALTLGAAAITLTGAGAVIWNHSTTGLTFSANTSTITSTGDTATFAGGNATFNTVALNGTSTTTLSGANTFANLTRTGAASKITAFTLSADQVITGTLTLSGNSAINRLLVQSNTLGTARTLTAATVTVTQSDFMDTTGAGAGSWNLAAITGNSGDCGGNSGITFTTAAAQTWAGTSGGNYSANAWTSRVPLPQDDATISAAFSASQTITFDEPRLGKNITFAGATGAPTLAFSSTANSVFGSLTLAAGLTLSGTQVLSLRGRGAFTLTSAGLTFTQAVSLLAPGGTYTLQDAFTCAGSLTVQNGTFVANNFNVTALNLLSSFTVTRGITMGTGTWTITGTTGTSVQLSPTTGLTFSGASATIVFASASSSARTFSGGGLTFGTLTYTVAGSTGALIITGANTFSTINFSDVTNARTLTLPAATTTTVTTFNVNGTAGKLMTVNSSSGGSAATLSKSSGTVSSDYLSLQDSAATGGAAWYAGANSTNVSGNSGWVFTAPPAGSTGNFLNFLRP